MTSNTEARPLLRAGFMEALIKRSEDAEQVLQDCGRIRFERTIRAAIELYREQSPPGGLEGGGMTSTKRHLAYVATVTKEGFGIGIAERDSPGYWPMPSKGTFPSYEAASERAKELNAEAGLSLEEAAEIICSSMRAQNKRDAQKSAGRTFDEQPKGGGACE